MTMAKETYPKSKGAGGQKGVDYQVNLLALFALEGLSLEKWKLSTEHELAGKFDDIVFQIDGYGHYLMQCKHKENKQSVSKIDFFSTNPKKSDFALIKYFDSFLTSRDKFKTKLLIICTNIGPNDAENIFKKESAPAPFQRVNNSYRLNESGIDDVKQFLNKTKPTEEQSLTEFCKKLRFFHISDEEIETSINDNIAVAGVSLKLKFNKNEFVKNINEWFLAEKGILVKKSHVKAFLYESCSQKYSEELNKHNIRFKENYDIDDNKIINVISGRDDFLNILKIHRSLEATYDSNNILFINTEHDVGTTEKIIESFELHRFTIVFISFCKIDQYIKIYSRLETILTKYSYKKAVILSKNPIQSDLPKSVIENEINFSDLTDTCQQTLLSKSVIFQGEYLTIQQVIKDSEDNIDSIINQEIIIDILNDKKIEISRAIPDLGDIKDYYMERTFIFKKDDKWVELKERDMCNLRETSGKFILISDGAGMGKTTILTKLGCLIKETYPNLFLVRIDLNKFTKIFKEFQKARKQSIDLEDILKSKGVVFSKNSFEHNIFMMTNKITLMVDAVDEISPNYTSLVKNFLLQTSKRKNIFKIFVTTRSHMTMELEFFLGTKSYKLLPYSKPEQIDFLKKFWKKKLNIDNDDKQKRCEMYAKTLIDKIGNAIGNTSLNFIGIPLQTKMIAEIFEGSKDKKYEWVCCKDYLVSENEFLELPKKLNITKLYDMFVEKKGEIFIDDKCDTRGNVAAEEIVSKHYDDALNEHQKCAARLLFKYHECSLLNIFKYVNNTSRETIIKMGIIQESGDELLFVHQTFAEYFVANVLWTQLNELEDSQKFLVFLLSTVLVKKEFEVIRAFFESILINESDRIREEVVRACGRTVDAIFWNKSKNIHVLAEEGRKHTLELILEKSENSRDVLERAPANSWRSILIRLWYRIRKRKKLLNIVNERTGETILARAILFPEILEFLLDKGADINKRDERGRTVLHKAAEHNVDLVEFLTNRGAKINIADKTGSTALIPIISSDHRSALRVFHHLINRGANVDVISEEITPLIAAVLKQNVEMVREITTRGANINIKPKGGATALHWAAFKGSVEILTHLLEKGAKVNVKNDYGDTPAHYATAKYNLDCLKLLVDKGADVTIKNNNGLNLLEYAIILEVDDVVNFLSQNKSVLFTYMDLCFPNQE